MVMASLSQNIPLPHSVVNLETLVACRALELSLELGLDKAILKGDSLIIMNALRDFSPSIASYGLLIHDAHLLANLFTSISFQHVDRDGNYVAHNLARHTRHVYWSFSLDRECSNPNFFNLPGKFAYHLIKTFKFFSKKKYIYILLLNFYYIYINII